MRARETIDSLSFLILPALHSAVFFFSSAIVTISKLVGWKLVRAVGSTTVKLSGTLGEKRGERKRIRSVWLGVSFIFSRVSGITISLDTERPRNSISFSLSPLLSSGLFARDAMGPAKTAAEIGPRNPLF